MDLVDLVDSHEVLSSIINSSDLDEDEAIREYLRQVKFPPIDDFKQGMEWFNVLEPLSFTKHLKGKVVLLDFFTYCCINCMHILPGLKEIEKEFSIEDGFLVIGVHSAKFENERSSSNVLSAVQRYNISHAVVNDPTSDMWNKCNIMCWPTLLLLGPKGNPLLMLMGEGHVEKLKAYVKISLEYYKSLGEISNHSLPLSPAFHLLPSLKGPLLFPGKIVNFVDKDKNEIIALSDTGNHRILILRNDGTILYSIGGNLGFKDGNYQTACFNSPQGLVFKDENTLYIADTENHAIRKIDLKMKTVETVVGNGKQGNDHKGGKIGKDQPISSPWDLCVFKTTDLNNTVESAKDILIIAMAGTHQIWALFFENTKWWKGKEYKAGTCVAIAGSGREENRNNQYPQNAAFAQPSGLALCKRNKEVYIADSESSSIRRLSLLDGKVSAVVGGDRNPNNLFAFGDLDGVSHNAKLQHLLGLTFSNDETSLYVADTYNHKIKKVDISKNSICTMTPPNTLDTTDGILRSFNEPSGLCITENRTMLVTDTNNHCIKEIELDKESNIKAIRIWELKLVDNKTSINETKFAIIQAGTINCGTNGKLVLKVKFSFAKGLKISEGAPQKWSANVPSFWTCTPPSGTDLNDVKVVINTLETESKYFDIVFNIITCTTESCYPKNFILRFFIQCESNTVSVKECVVTVLLGPDEIKLI